MELKEKIKLQLFLKIDPSGIILILQYLGLGAIDVPLYPISTSDSIEFILNNSESVGIIVSTKFQLNKVLKLNQNVKHLKFIINMSNDSIRG